MDEEWKGTDPSFSWISGLTWKIKDSLHTLEQQKDEEAKGRLPKEDEEKVWDLFSRLDDKLKEECFLCGQYLIDSLDNDIHKFEGDDKE